VDVTLFRSKSSSLECGNRRRGVCGSSMARAPYKKSYKQPLSLAATTLKIVSRCDLPDIAFLIMAIVMSWFIIVVSTHTSWDHL